MARHDFFQANLHQEYPESFALRQQHPSYHIHYVSGNAPHFHANGMVFVVRELTEQSVGIVSTRPDLFQVGQTLKGILLFTHGDSYRVDGEIQRQHGDTVFIALAQPLPATLLIREQHDNQAISDRRQFFRLRYNRGEGPSLLIGNIPHEVIELSEQGIVFRLSLQGDLFAIGQQILGILHLEGNVPLHVSGTILRIRMSERVVHLSVQGIPPKMMFQEQRRVLAQRHTSS